MAEPLRRGRTVVLAAAMIAATSGTTAAQTPQRAPRSTQAWTVLVPAPDPAARAGVQPGVAMTVRIDQLAQAAVDGGTIELPLGNGLTVRMAIEWASSDAAQTFVAGPLIEGRNGEASLTAVGDTVAGRIVVDGRLFVVRRVPNSTVHVVQEVDPATLPEGPDDAVGTPPGDAGADHAIGSTPAGDTGAVIDLLIVYTPAARAAAGGTAIIQTEATAAVNNANAALAASGIAPRLRIVHMEEIEFVEVPGDMREDLTLIETVGDGDADRVHALRDQYRADVVTLLVRRTQTDYAGFARVISAGQMSVSAFQARAFNVMGWSDANLSLTLAHEVGHNMGLQHDYHTFITRGGTTPHFNYAYGYRVPGVARDLMSYPCEPDGFASCPRKTIFSTPLFSFPGTAVAAGTVYDDGARAITNASAVVANFRDSTCTYTVTASAVKFWKNGGNGTISVTSSGGACGWAAVSLDTWITLSGTRTTTGDGSLSYTVGASTGVARSASLVVAGQTITIDQSADPAVITFTTQPTHQLTSHGSNVSFTVAATSAAPITYQWRKNGADITGATGPTLSLSGTRQSDIGLYTVRVRNVDQTATSNAAVLAMSGLYRFCTIAEYVTGPVFGGGGSPTACAGSYPLTSWSGVRGVAANAGGYKYVAAASLIGRFAPANNSVATFAGSGTTGSEDGTGTTARFSYPDGIAIDQSGTLYVTDAVNNNIRRITPAGAFQPTVVTTVAGQAGESGSADGTGSSARFSHPKGIAVDVAGTLYVTDYLNHTIRKIASGGVVTTLAGKAGVSGSTNGTGSDARFTSPHSIAVDAGGNLYVTEYSTHAIRKITPAGVVTTLAGSPGLSGLTDGAGSAARFNGPTGIAVESSGDLIVGDSVNLVIRRVTPAGVVTTIAGIPGGKAGVPDGVGTDAGFLYPYGVALDPAGRLYVTGNRNAVRQGTPVAAPVISASPQNATVDCRPSCTSTTFSTTASGATGHQWQVSTDRGATWTDVTDAPYSNTTSASLTVAASGALSGYQFRALAYNQAGWTTSNSATLTVNTYEVSASRTALLFRGTNVNGTLSPVTGAQDVTVGATQTSLVWTATANQPWIQITNGSATGPGRFTVTMINPGNVIGANAEVRGVITITAPEATNAPLSIPVTFTLTAAGLTAAPFGSFDTPANAATVQGSIAVTGWALDDVGVNRVEVWRNCLESIDRSRGACASPAVGLPANSVFLGRAFLLAGARPDVETANPTYPLAYRAGWGFMLLTNALPHQILNTSQGGQGSYVLTAFAIDEENRATLLGTKTISVDNDHATAPFGAIDTPGQGATIPEGAAPFNNVNAYPAFGWAMTQAGKCIDVTSTAAYRVFIDGVQRPLTPGTNWVAGLNRSDLAAAYPGLCNSNNALAVYYINAAALGLTSGLHTISWDVTDSASQTVFGLGTRFFNVVASGSDPGLDAAPVAVGNATQLALASSHRDVQLAIGGRLSLDLGQSVDAGYQQVGTVLRALPPGSTLDGAAGTFAWEPPAGFFGPFELVFTRGSERIDVTVTIVDGTVVPVAIAMHVDTPTDGAVVTGTLTVGGWALDPQAVGGSGIDAVHVWAVRRDVPGFGSQFVGAATLNLARPDVAQAFGAQFSAAGFQLTTSTLPPGTYEVTVYARRQSSGQWEATRTAVVTIR